LKINYGKSTLVRFLFINSKISAFNLFRNCFCWYMFLLKDIFHLMMFLMKLKNA